MLFRSAPRYVGAPEAAPVRAPAPFLIQFWRSAVGKKWVMAITGIMLIGFVFGHMVGNLKIYLGAEALDHYAEWLRTIGYPALPKTAFLWITRTGLLAAVVLHIWAAVSLTRMNHAARPVKYQSSRDYVAANYAARTMRWTGVIVLAFIIFHLLDLTWGATNPDFVKGAVYDNGLSVFAMGLLGPNMDDITQSVSTFFAARYPDFKPKRILDLGCTIGHSTLAWKDRYPDAEVHGIDVAAPCVR